MNTKSCKNKYDAIWAYNCHFAVLIGRKCILLKLNVCLFDASKLFSHKAILIQKCYYIHTHASVNLVMTPW